MSQMLYDIITNEDTYCVICRMCNTTLWYYGAFLAVQFNQKSNLLPGL